MGIEPSWYEHATNRTTRPPRSPFTKSRRVWVDAVAELTTRSRAVEVSDHARRAWVMVSVHLTAACPKRGEVGTTVIESSAVEEVAWRFVRQHIAACTCTEEDWKWTGLTETDGTPTQLEEEA